jgi:hypothetical protein
VPGVAIGVVLAVVLKKVPKITRPVACFVGGIVCAILLNILFLAFIGYLAFYFAAAAIGAGFVVFSFVAWAPAFIISVATTGAYFVIRGLSALFGGFPNELLFYKDYSENSGFQVRRRIEAVL